MMTEPVKPLGRYGKLAVTGSALLVVCAAGLFYHASQTATGPERGQIYKVTVGAKTCDPMDFTLPAGRATFEIHNASDRPIEWEILDGVMVVEERENIAPGFHSALTAKLKPGTFEITCGLLSNPRGRLVVTPSAQSQAEGVAPPVTAFIGPLSEFKVYSLTQSRDLVAQVDRLRQAVGAGDLEQARSAWHAARLPYKRLEAVMDRAGDLENSIDPLSDYLEKRQDDPAFTGFHRIEYGLWGQNDTAGLLPVADRLLADVTALQDRLRGLKLAPADLAEMAARQADRLATGQIVTGQNHWAQTDSADIAAGLDGIAKIAGLLHPLLVEADPAATAAYDTALDAAQRAVAGGDARQTATAFAALSTAIAAINPAIGLEGGA